MTAAVTSAIQPAPATHTGATTTPEDAAELAAIAEALEALRASMRKAEASLAARDLPIDAAHAAGARNLVHYLALRSGDRRALQQALAAQGLSSLGRSESHAMAAVERVLSVLQRLGAGNGTASPAAARRAAAQAGIGKLAPPVSMREGRALLQQHAVDLLGPAPDGRGGRIMVTLPSEAAEDDDLVRRLVDAGMDIARINTAHDDAATWRRMAERVRAAATRRRRQVRVLVDLAGPKLRTGTLGTAEAVLKVRPRRSPRGEVLEPALLGLVPQARAEAGSSVRDASATVGVDAAWLEALKPDDEIELRDARNAKRVMRVVRTGPHQALVELDRTAYLTPQTVLKRSRVRSRDARGPRRSTIGALPPASAVMRLSNGDRLRLVDTLPPHSAFGDDGLPLVPCTLPQVFAQVRPGDEIAFDDGRIRGAVREAGPEGLLVEITHAGPDGAKLASDKGINLPDTPLKLVALTEDDQQALATVAEIADMVGVSFVQHAEDVHALREALAKLGAADLGLVLKIETRRAYANLPELMLAAMAGPKAGVMIARGDLAVECGWERLAELQEEILWAAEAAHLPVIWATQVLETLARTGQPSRAEVTDAAMGQRAECVMLNKGPYIAEAIEALDEILRRMQGLQAKNRSLLPAAGVWKDTGAPRAM